MAIARFTLADEGGRTSEIVVGRNLADAANLLVEGPRRAAVLAQPSVSRLAAGIAEGIERAGLSAAVRILPDREEAKTLTTVESVFEWLNTLGFTRADMAIAVGGGAITDVTGFVAATYMRGIEVTYLPTTLLAAVDASIGGKTGVNVGGKNLAGVFRHPARVVVDLDVLAQLPVELLREGAAETVKAGFIADPAIMAEYESNGVAAALDVVVPAAIAVKVETVGEDFREAGQESHPELRPYDRARCRDGRRASATVKRSPSAWWLQAGSRLWSPGLPTRHRQRRSSSTSGCRWRRPRWMPPPSRP